MCLLYRDKVGDNASMISPVLSVVKPIDLPDKKYAGARINVKVTFQSSGDVVQ